MNKIKYYVVKYHVYALLFFLSVMQSFYFLSVGEKLIKNLGYTVATFVFYLLLTSISQKLLKFFMVFSFLLTLFIFPTQIVYGKADLNYLYSIYYTNTTEAMSYIDVVPVWVYFSLLGLAVYSYVLLKIQYHVIQYNFKVKVLLFLILLVLPSAQCVRHGFNRELSLYSHVIPINRVLFLNMFYDVIEQDNFLAEEAKRPSSWRIIDTSNRHSNHNIVLVIGESIRRDFLHAHGFPIKNTPFIDNSPHIQFNNYISPSFATVTSLLRTICLSNDMKDCQINNNVISLAKDMGYETFWISNQFGLNRGETPITMIAKRADSYTFMRLKTHDHCDMEMIPYLQKCLQKDDNNKLIVLHMMGSHPPASDITKGEYNEFIRSEEVSCYNKTIRDTDTFLQQIYKSLMDVNQDFDFIYFSDHGLKLIGNKFVHSGTVKEGYNPPLILWSNSITQSKAIDNVRQGKDFLHLFSQILGVKTSNIDKHYRFISEEKDNNNGIEVINGDENLSDYNTLESNPSSELFEK